MRIFRRFGKHKSLRIVNVLGLAVVFACLLLSYSHIKKERSYDRFHKNAERIVRMSVQYDNDPVDGRIFSPNIPDQGQLPEVEQIVKLSRVNTGLLIYQGKPHMLNNFYFASPNFFDVFTIPLVEGSANQVLQAEDQVVISETFARSVFGTDSPLGKKVILDDRGGELPLTVVGIFKDFPEAAHFHTDAIVYRPETQQNLAFVYLQVKEGCNLQNLQDKLTKILKENHAERQTKVEAKLMPLLDIHLHSRNLREMEPNGNIHFIYLTIGANALLLIVVLFNLWLNSSLIFSHNRRYYCLLRLNGASSHHILKEEAMLAAMLGVLSLAAGLLISSLIASSGYFALDISPVEYMLVSLAFLFLIVVTSLIPLAAKFSTGLFPGTMANLKPACMIHTQIRIMLVIQYTVVMLVVILAFGMGKQLNMIKNTQVGGSNRDIIVLIEQPQAIQEKYALLKDELLKHPEILSVTGAMEPPGGAVRDYIDLWEDNREEKKTLPVFVVGEDFIPFFNIPVAGRPFPHDRFTRQEHEKWLGDYFVNKKPTDIQEEYMINKKALAILGYDSPQEVIGKSFHIGHIALGYIRRGVICGVTDDFNFTSMHEESIPMLMLQRPMFLHNIMVQLDPDQPRQAIEVFHKVWKEIYPDYPARYTPIQDVYGMVFRNELNAGELVRIFSLLCFLIANLGLIIYMAFIIGLRTKEIGIRKVNGAQSGEIVRMLNRNFIWLIILAFVFATPAAFLILQQWLRNFAYKITLSWWIFAVAGMIVLLVSILSISWQSWRAATANPVDSIKKE